MSQLSQPQTSLQTCTQICLLGESRSCHLHWIWKQQRDKPSGKPLSNFFLISLMAMGAPPKGGLHFTIAANVKYQQWKVLLFASHCADKFIYPVGILQRLLLPFFCGDLNPASFLFIMDWTPVAHTLGTLQAFSTRLGLPWHVGLWIEMFPGSQPLQCEDSHCRTTWIVSCKSVS